MELTSTSASAVASALLAERRKAGSPSMGMVMTFIVVTDEGDHYDALRTARSVSREHPARILGIIKRSARGAPNLDAELSIGGSGETVLLRMSGELTRHAESVVLPLLLPDSPVVVWWPRRAPDDPAADPLGKLAQRRITDSAAMERGKTQAILTQSRNYAAGNTDLAWTRVTPWRALLAAALDQYPARVRRGQVEAERTNPSADLLVAWLTDCLGVPVERVTSKGPGITSVTLKTGGGPIEIARPDGLLAEFTIPNAPNRPVALKRRDTAELLAEELRRLDPDDIYAETVKRLCKLADGLAKSSGPRSTRGASKKDGDRPSAAKDATTTPISAAKVAKLPEPSERDSVPSRRASAKGSAKRPGAKKTPAKKTSRSR